MLKERLCPGCMEPFSGQSVCPRCGYSPGDRYDPDYLRPGMTLNDGRYLVGAVARKNGEGATYAGFDRQNREACWIREYFPTKLARRDANTGGVSPLEGCEAQYKALASDFIEINTELKRLAVTERVVPVIGEFIDHTTVYTVYKKMRLVDLNSYLAANGGKLAPDKALDIFMPFCNMLGNIHDRGYIHRGVSPYTVYADEGGTLYLWDFCIGAARTANSELIAELFNGYSAPEQYSSNSWQGTWTDVYALAALFYRMVSGFVPPKSTLVDAGRPVSALDDLVMDIPKNISDAIRDAMLPATENRTQSVYAFTSALIGTEIASTSVYDTVKPRERREPAEKDGGFKYAIAALVLTVLVLVGSVWFVMSSFFPQMLEQTPTESESPPSADFDVIEDSEQEPEPPEPEEVGVPDFVGVTMESIENDASLADRFNFIIKEEYNGDFPVGMIFDQSPEKDTPMPGRGAVILYVSLGPELVIMPDLKGRSYEDALRILGENNLSSEKIDRHVVGAEPDSVVGTIPSAGEEFDPQKQQISVFVMPGQQEESQESGNGGGGSASSSKSSATSRSSSSSKSSADSKNTDNP